jgi:hypothetical protein
MTAMILVVVAVAVLVANSPPFNGRFLPGILIVVLPFLLLAFLLPKVIPVCCPNCNGRMRFRWLGTKRSDPTSKNQTERKPDLYAYVCDACGEQHAWEGSDSGHGLD